MTLDLILCSGTSLMSRSIRRINKLMGKKGDAADISHVALRITTICLQQVFEATTRNRWADKKGVQINPYHKWLIHYSGSVYIRSLVLPESVNILPVRDVLKTYIGTDYESGIPGLLELGLTFLPGFKLKQTPELHCSEVDVKVLQDLDLYHKNVLPNKMPPCEFWPGGMFEQHLLCPIGKPVKIK